MDYIYTHSISYYIGNNRINNIYSAIDHLHNYKLSIHQTDTDKVLLIICCIYDEINDNIKYELNNLKNKKTNKVDIEVIFRWNSGGTVQTMSKTLDYLLDKNISTKYIGVWEDDSIFKNNLILDDVQNGLNRDNIIVGCHVPEGRPDILHMNGIKIFKKEYLNKRQKDQHCPWCKNKHIYLNEKLNEDPNKLIDDSLIKWIDGAVYITTIQNLLKIKQKLQKFTLAPEDHKYTHIEHGINYGEVGFPTRLNINGFKFYGLLYDDFYKHLSTNSVGDKSI